ncbi:YceD family protein [Clostridium sp. Marseille-P299]|uniref:YceD family protein n=1 Tax=Clostridium sp. Marseille-P299 TaxID=1805477 RepID=UPI00083752AA|nr:DUF177 domain-containing protein [Clostridium sp. Marseille-P299]
MLVQLSEIMNINDGVRKMTVPIEFDTFELNGNTYKVHEKDSVQLTIKNLGNRKVLIDAKTNLSLYVPCDRCLKPVLIPFDIDTSKEIDFNLTTEQRTEDLDETTFITGYELDVDRLICEEVLIGFPMKVLCKDDCKGFCKVCGANLNDGECGCDRTELDPRMSVIRDIFNNFKEV